MKRKMLRCSLLIICLPFFAFAGNDEDRVEKKINRQFTIATNGRVEIENKYGSLDIGIGPDNVVKMDIIISAASGNEKKAQEAIDKITVDFEEGNNRVRATTQIETTSSWTSWFNTGRVDLQINYQVQVPADVYLDLVLKYGNLYVETTNRDISIDLAYGDIRLGDINGKLSLDMDYSDGAISRIQDGDLQLAYSDLAMEDGKNISMDIKYTDVVAGTFENLRLVSAYSDLHSISVRDVHYEGKYDDFVIEQVNQIQAQTGYSEISIGELNGTSKFDMRYGELVVRNISRNFSNMNINTSYTGVQLVFKSDASFVLDAVTNYCDIKQSGLKVTENIEKSSSVTLKGSRGSGGGNVYARMNYGELVIQ